MSASGKPMKCPRQSGIQLGREQIPLPVPKRTEPPAPWGYQSWAHSDSAGLRPHALQSVSNPLSGDADAAGPGPHTEQPGWETEAPRGQQLSYVPVSQQGPHSPSGLAVWAAA